MLNANIWIYWVKEKILLKLILPVSCYIFNGAATKHQIIYVLCIQFPLSSVALEVWVEVSVNKVSWWHQGSR